MEERDMCTTCTKRPHCETLCPEAELYGKQDEPNYHKSGDGTHFTPMEKKIVTLIMKGKTRAQIRKALKLSPDALRAHVKRLRKKRDQIVL